MKQGNSLVTLVIVLLAVMLAAYLGVYAWDSFYRSLHHYPHLLLYCQ